MICERVPQIDIRKLRLSPDELPDVSDLPFGLTTTECRPFGGRRVWFVCAGCNGRCAILYLIGAPKCRKCAGLRYEAEAKSPAGRQLLCAFKRRAALGQKRGGVLTPFPKRPKYMRWDRYHRILAEGLSDEEEILARLMKGLPKPVRMPD